ncbi:hypothetical protein SAMN04487848_3052 [Microbacterium sp. ru370.1]|uniref:GIN domain-containing protein n=1 Tax=unclassified Microbacterium TaxID=2609290 RepID=UPI00088EFD11|nr:MULTISPECIES: DUF2807 domain-containing protein [unclassified Microbacterium]SDP02483.1 hypothetical protein SAMN04487848_3052 [Microbacterium sp. ru370.1]SIT91884.1 hypothetical protein SAMN05880579_2527 [Microbacterium sp. RU1D]
MTTQAPLPAPAAPEPPRRRGAAFAVSIVTIAVGACVALGTLAGTAASAVVSLRDTDRESVSVSDATRAVDSLDIDVTGGALTIAYGDVDSARLDATSGRAGWTFERRGDALRVASPNGTFVGWNTGSSATITLPRDWAGTGLGVDAQVSGGSLDLEGDYGSLSIRLAGGTTTLNGAAGELELDVSGGSASVQLRDVGTAVFEVAGGEVTAQLRGSTPLRTDVELTAGSVDLRLPDDEYRVSLDDGLGQVDNALRQSPTATAEVDVTATMGEVRLRS